MEASVAEGHSGLRKELKNQWPEGAWLTENLSKRSEEKAENVPEKRPIHLNSVKKRRNWWALTCKH